MTRALRRRYSHASATLTDTQRRALAAADASGYIEPLNVGYKALDGLARRGLVEHMMPVTGTGGTEFEVVPGPVRYRPGNQYGRVYKHSRVVRQDIFRITDAGRAVLTSG